jgi:hypothetical protein
MKAEKRPAGQFYAFAAFLLPREGESNETHEVRIGCQYM